MGRFLLQQSHTVRRTPAVRSSRLAVFTFPGTGLLSNRGPVSPVRRTRSSGSCLCYKAFSTLRLEFLFSALESLLMSMVELWMGIMISEQKPIGCFWGLPSWASSPERLPLGWSMTEAAEFRDYFVLGGLLESKQETWKSKSSWEAQTCSVLEGTLHHLPQTAVLSQAALSVCLSVHSSCHHPFSWLRLQHFHINPWD